MKTKKFKRVVECDKESLIGTIINFVALFLCFLYGILWNNLFLMFLSGGNFMGFCFNLIDYMKSRKVYWEEIK